MNIVGSTGLGGLTALEWAWHTDETNYRCARSSGIYMPSPIFPRSQRSYLRTDRRTRL